MLQKATEAAAMTSSTGMLLEPSAEEEAKVVLSQASQCFSITAHRALEDQLLLLLHHYINSDARLQYGVNMVRPL